MYKNKDLLSCRELFCKCFKNEKHSLKFVFIRILSVIKTEPNRLGP